MQRNATLAGRPDAFARGIGTSGRRVMPLFPYPNHWLLSDVISISSRLVSGGTPANSFSMHL
jgi:hypothetical protein